MVNPSAMVDAMGHEQWAEWQAFDHIYPVAHQTRMIGLIARMLASHENTDFGNVATPWIGDDTPDTPEKRDASTSAVIMSAPSGLSRGVTTSTAQEYVL